MKTATNMEPAVVRAFGEEWSRFDQVELSHDDFRRLFTSYFEVFPWERLPRNAQGFDLGCGSGRWARGVAPCGEAALYRSKRSGAGSSKAKSAGTAELFVPSSKCRCNPIG